MAARRLPPLLSVPSQPGRTRREPPRKPAGEARAASETERAPTEARESAAGRWLRRNWKKAAIGLFVANAVLLPLLLGGGPEAAPLPDWVPTTFWSFVLAHALAVGIAVPTSPFCLGAGMLFGLGRGALAATLGATLGAVLAFAVGRLLARPLLRRVVRRLPTVRRFLAALGDEGFRTVLLVRLSPLFPFSVQNFGWSLTPVRFRDYLLGSIVGIPLGAVLFAHLGAAGTAGAALAGDRFSWSGLFTLLGIAVTVPVVRRIAKLADRVLGETVPAAAEATGQRPPRTP